MLAERILQRRSAFVCDVLGRYFAWFLARNFHAVRIARSGARPPFRGGPLIVVSNHPSWWEPVIYVLLGRTLFRDRIGFGPMDETGLRKYRILERFGVFGVDLHSRAGALDFVAVAQRLLAAPERMLWIAAQGRFADARERPVRLRAGPAHLARRMPNVQLVPLAIELAFWDERYPEIFLRFGHPVTADEDLDRALEATMDALAQDVQSRDAARFDLLLGGKAGVGGVYDMTRRFASWARFKRFHAGHR
ncbi:acyltransferase [Rhodospirillales bacterium TMPK1]|uniref:Acyltransferase n=2 Tax=Roseiterribacter gracilis TaxID=2812848 RepID=A0A8S8XEM0_9PROT|nr:acyltransferase [Rhodospirillales bacterium TMPK1]